MFLSLTKQNLFIIILCTSIIILYIYNQPIIEHFLPPPEMSTLKFNPIDYRCRYNIPYKSQNFFNNSIYKYIKKNKCIAC